jgi:phosphotransferase system HPr (HPr) family protein
MPASSETVVQLPDDVDLHARPAAQFVRTAMLYAAAITVYAGERHADAKSVLAVLGLGARRGTQLRLCAEGGDSVPALAALTACVVGFVE